MTTTFSPQTFQKPNTKAKNVIANPQCDHIKPISRSHICNPQWPKLTLYQQQLHYKTAPMSDKGPKTRTPLLPRTRSLVKAAMASQRGQMKTPPAFLRGAWG